MEIDNEWCVLGQEVCSNGCLRDYLQSLNGRIPRYLCFQVACADLFGRQKARPRTASAAGKLGIDRPAY